MQPAEMSTSRAPQMEAFGKLVSAINSRLGYGVTSEHILDFIFDSLELVIPFDRIGIALLDGEKIRLHWVRSKIPVRHLVKDFTMPLKNTSLEAIQMTGEPRIINDLLEYSRSRPDSVGTAMALKDGLRSSITFPLRAGDASIGFIFFSSATPGAYSTQHEEIFRSIAEEVAVLIHQAELQSRFDLREERDVMLNRVLHDLRSPLAVFQGFLDLAFEEDWFLKVPQGGRDILAILKRNADHMLNMVNEVADLRQLQRPAALDKSLISPGDLMEEFAMSAVLQARRKEVVVSLSLERGLPDRCLVDRQKIWRVLENLVSNAIKFSERGSEIALALSEQNGKLRFSVRDQGQGIREEELPLLFREYGRTSTKPTEGETSTGLGLAICKRVVELHGGSIGVRSSPGNGSEFFFEIPIVEKELKDVTSN